ncbi:hypothetical protein CTI12_AA344170 [Artemisia annua]|uniref:Uncharacterized protein n=1 Tax=Artemisia annua TaxID=35608 RepID=A0A2U1MSN7_ARTAN|nr:hypothetical protein CTI12_AA344170 [Artemisia annua]
MSTMKAQDGHEDRTTIEEEKVEHELDRYEISRLCKEHARGVSATDGVSGRKATTDCQDSEDGSGGKDDKSSEKKQQADHYKSTMNKT